MRAIILAAGEGKRLRPHTADRPKCLVELAGKPLLVHQVESLTTAGVTDITVVTGYRADQIEALGYRALHNPDYDRTNMVATLMCAKSILDGGDNVLVCYADIVYRPQVVTALTDCVSDLATTVDRRWRDLWRLRLDEPMADAETLKIDCQGNIAELGKKPNSYDDIQAQYMGLIKIGAAAAQQVVTTYENLDPSATYDGKDRANMYMTSFLQHLIDHVRPVRAVAVDGGWLEVDSADDLALYRQMYASGELARFWHPVPATRGE